MAETARAHRLKAAEEQETAPLDTSGPLPPPKYSLDETDGWVTFEEPVFYLQAGKGAFVHRYAAFCTKIINIPTASSSVITWRSQFLCLTTV